MSAAEKALRHQHFHDWQVIQNARRDERRAALVRAAMSEKPHHVGVVERIRTKFRSFLDNKRNNNEDK